MGGEEEGFKVTDRRGRSGGEEGTASQVRPPSPEAPRVSPRPPRAAVAPPAPAEAPEAGPDLAGLFVMFASSALVNLGEAADPTTGQRQVDLEQAREAIEVLLLLRDKTAGNRTEQESRILEEILYDLQMRFVRATEGGRRL